MTQQMADFTLTIYATVTTDATADFLEPANGVEGFVGRGVENRLASVGTFEFDLDNAGSEGKYQFGHSNCLAGWKKNTPIELSFTYDGDEIVKRFYAKKTEVAGELGERIHVIAADWLIFPTLYPVVNPDMLSEATADEAFEELLLAFIVQPQNTDFDTGSNILRTILDTVNRNTKAYTEFSKVVDSELGYAYLQQPETFVLENMMHRNGLHELSQIPIISDDLEALQDEDSNTITDEDSDPILACEREDVSVSTTNGEIISFENESGENVINRFTSTSHPRRTDEDAVILFEPERPVFIPSGGRWVSREYFFDPTTKKPINAIPPEEDSYTKALLHFEGIIGHQQTVEDETGRIWTPYDMELVRDVFGTSPKFGDSCAYFDGSSSYLTAPDSPDWDFGSGDFTIDWWEYRFDTASGIVSISRDALVTYPAFQFGRSNGSSLLVDMSSAGVSNDIASGKTLGTITTGQFVHLAVVRSGSNFYTFKNGVLQDTWTSALALNPSTSVLYVARQGSNYLDGTIDELRISKGIARWTSAFTPPTTAYELQGTFVRGFANEDGTGTEFTDSLTVSVDYGTEGATYDIQSAASISGYLFIRTFGYGVHLDSPSDDIQIDQPSIDDFSEQDARLDMPYQQNNVLGILEARRIIEQEKTERTVLHSITMNANKTPADMMRFLYTKVGALVDIDIPKIEKDAYFFVQGIEWDLYSKRLIDYTWKVKEHYSLSKGLDDLAIEFRGGANTDCITFPYMPYVCGDEVTAFSISAWVYLDTEPVSLSYFVAGPFMDGAGAGLFIGTTDRKVVFYQTRFDVSPGQWSSPADPFALTTWAHLTLTWEISTATTPKIYVNATSVSLTQDTVPSGSLTSAVGANFFIGNVKTPGLNYTRCFDGKIKDVRFYPYILSQAEITTIYNGGTYNPLVGNNGQVFQAPAVHSARYADYEDLTLTTDDKVIDAHLGIVGTPNGSPVSRYP